MYLDVMDTYKNYINDELHDWAEEHGLKQREYDPYKLFSDLPIYDRCINVMSLENCMCELSKYIKAVKGTGRPRNKYTPYKEDKE